MATSALYTARQSRRSSVLGSSTENVLPPSRDRGQDMEARMSFSTRPTHDEGRSVKRSRNKTFPVATDQNIDEQMSRNLKQASSDPQQIVGSGTPERSRRRDLRNAHGSRSTRSDRRSSRPSGDSRKEAAGPKSNDHGRHESWNGTQTHPRFAHSKRASLPRSASTPQYTSGMKETPKDRKRWSFLGSLFRSSTTPAENPVYRTVECFACGNDVRMTRIMTLDCGHKTCNPCLRRAFILSVEDEAHMPPRCCTVEHIRIDCADALLNAEFKALWTKKYEEYQTRNQPSRPKFKQSESRDRKRSIEENVDQVHLGKGVSEQQARRSSRYPSQRPGRNSELSQQREPDRRIRNSALQQPQDIVKQKRHQSFTQGLASLEEDPLPAHQTANEEVFGNAAPNFLNENFVPAPRSLTMENLQEAAYGRRGERQSGRKKSSAQVAGHGGLAPNAFGTQSMLGIGPPPTVEMRAKPRRSSLLRTGSKGQGGEGGGGSGKKEGGGSGFKRWLSRL